jgi:predicted RNA-binding Zn ribbon-like protein
MNLVPLVGEPLALDLVNTRVRGPDGGELDLLGTPDALDRWLAQQRGRVSAPFGEVDLTALHTLREHIAEAVEHARHGSEPPAAALRALNEAQESAPAHRQLSWDGTAVSAATRRSGDSTMDLLAELAEAAGNLLADPSIRTVRPCEGPACRLLFLPVHPRRRWCSPALCGNRTRVARYYERHRSEPGSRRQATSRPR